MQVVEVTAKDSISIIFVGDLHLGDPESLYPNVMQFLRESDDYIVFLGDVLDTGVAGSITNVHNQSPNISQQISMFLEDLKALAPRTVLFIPGNHEERLNKKAGVRLQDIIFSTLGIPTSDDFAVIDITTPGNVGTKKRFCYRVAVAHGIAGGRFPEKSIRQGRYFVEMVHNVDMYVLGHTHQPSVFYQEVYVYDDRNKDIIRRQTIVANIGGMTDSEYARKMLLKPSPNLLFKATFHANNRLITTQFVQI